MPRTPTTTKANRKRGAGTPGDPTVVPVLAHGRYRSDQSYAIAIGIAVGIVIVGALALAAWLHYIRGVDLSSVFRFVLAPGGLVAVSLPAVATILRERLAPAQAGIQREVAAFKVELEKERLERGKEQGGDATKIAALEGKVGNLDRIVGELVGAVRQLAVTQEQTGNAVIAQRAGIDAATNAALEATGAVVHLQNSLLEAARAGAELQRQDHDDARREEEERVWARQEDQAAREAADRAADLEHARVEEEQSAHVRAAGARLRAANAAADAARVITGEVTAAAPLPPLPAAEPVAVEEVAVHEQVHYFHPDWTPPATGVTPVVPPKRHPDDDTAIHTFIHSGRWPEGFDPDNPPPRRVRRSE